MTIQVAIPSYRRAKTVMEKTVPLLLDRGVEKGGITVFVSDPEEFAAYQTTTAGSGINLALGALSTRLNRSAIHRHYRKGTKVVSIDDDITDIIERQSEKTAAPLRNLPAFFQRAFDIAASARLNLWGVYPVANPYFMKPTITTDLRFIVGCLYGFTADPEAEHHHTVLDEKEDYERCIKFYERDNGVLRINFVAPVTRYYKEPGGMQEYRTPQKSAHAAAWLLERYPQYVKTKPNAKTGYTEILLKDRRK